jgi:prepilin-type N-terminal cleavage/methylation domain-containing protein
MKQYNMKIFKKGFTLIELLVVIAIIGLLSSVVLASLQSARQRGKQAAVISNLVTVRTKTDTYFFDKGSYGPAFSTANCPTSSGTSMFGSDSNMRNAIAAAKRLSLNNGNALCSASVYDEGAGREHTFSVLIENDPGVLEFCLDQNGAIYLSQDADIFFNGCGYYVGGSTAAGGQI